jgi:hypothetical protein
VGGGTSRDLMDGGPVADVLIDGGGQDNCEADDWV